MNGTTSDGGVLGWSWDGNNMRVCDDWSGNDVRVCEDWSSNDVRVRVFIPVAIVVVSDRSRVNNWLWSQDVVSRNLMGP